MCYEAHPPELSFQYGENLQTLLTGKVLPILHGHVLCKIWHLCGVCWEDRKHKD